MKREDMNCEHISCEALQHELDAFIDAKLEPELLASMQQHISCCAACASSIEAHKQLKSVLRRVNVAPIDSTMAARFLRMAQIQAEQQSMKQQRRQSFIRGFAAAAVFAGFVSLGNHILSVGPSVQPVYVAAESGTVQEVQIIIYVPEGMDNANIALELPQGVSVEGFDELRSLAWQTNLQKGANQLSLPLRLNPGADSTQEHSIVANVEHNNEVKRFELKVHFDDVAAVPMTLKPQNTLTKKSV